MITKELAVIEENDFWRISVIEDSNFDHVSISFSSTPRIGEKFATEEFVGTVSAIGTSLFVIDKTNSYGNKIDIYHIANTINQYVQNKTVSLVGFCMGGFLGIAFSKLINNVKNVVAITPQWSVHPEYVGDTYLKRYTTKISDWKIKTLDDSFDDSINYYIFASDDPTDILQTSYFPQDRANIRIFRFGPDFDHDLPGQLGNNLSKFVTECFKDNTKNIDAFIEQYYEDTL
jgi:hypothetical protein